ncbi:MAG: ATP-dependent zinc metalloprotease FtsH [Clostridia bacterium]|nr:ATP-dependent zinc metalloprotease FtsH [Clostridia bacterium]
MSKNNSRKYVWYAVIILVIIGLFIFAVNTMSAKEKHISYTEFKTMVEENEVTDVYIDDYTIYVRKANSKIKSDNFPDKYDYYCKYMNNTVLIEFLEEHNDLLKERFNDEGKSLGYFVTNEAGEFIDAEGNVIQAGEDDYVKGFVIDYDGQWDEGSWLSTAMPYIGFAIVIIITIIVFRQMSGGGSKAGGFGRSKARLVVSSKIKFADVAGADEEKRELEELADFLKNPQRYTDLGARIPKGVLLVGPPGTGKTLLAKAVAGEAKVPFFSISGSDFVELYVGVGASRVRDLFAQAKANAPCIVFIDEIDAVGRQRGAGMGGGNDEREQTLNQLLVEMDGFESNSGIIILAATNRADVLDPALMRPGRFDRQVYVHIPDVKGREEIIKIHIKNKPLSDDVDIKRIARLTSGFAGADIENMLNEAALMTARDKRVKISMIDIQEGINKVLMGPKKVSRLITEDDKKITAVHESGHAIIARVLPNCDKVQEISIIPRGNAGGYTLTLDEKDRSHMTKQKLIDSITMMLGGRAAEEVMLDDITTGASNDLQRATDLAKKMVAEWGMSKEFGLISVGEGSEVFVGRDYQRKLGYSNEIASKIDAETKVIIEEAYKKAIEILSGKKDLIANLQKVLLEKETIYNEEFELLFNGKSVEEVEKIIDEKEKEKREYQEKARLEAEKFKFEKDRVSQLETAKALLRTGVINEKDFEGIKMSIEKEHSKINAENSKSDQESEAKVEKENQTHEENKNSTTSEAEEKSNSENSDDENNSNK